MEGTGSFVRAAVVAAVVVAVVASAIPAAARGRYGIGDSVMLGAKSQLRARGLKVNAVKNRQFSEVPRLIHNLRAAGKLRSKVIIHVGNNGTIDRSDCGAAVRAARNRHVYLVTLKVPRPYRRSNNRVLKRCAAASGRASLVDWFSYSVNHPGWFASDGYHLTSTGANKYARLIDRRTS
jgi:hypothetical protein